MSEIKSHILDEELLEFLMTFKGGDEYWCKVPWYEDDQGKCKDLCEELVKKGWAVGGNPPKTGASYICYYNLTVKGKLEYLRAKKRGK